MNHTTSLVTRFRNAIEMAKNNGEFNDDFSFYKFPRGCCGDTSDLLAQFLLEHGIKTYYVFGTFRPGSFEDIQTHAWILTENQIIIDITGDQFSADSNYFNYDKSVYIGETDNFHALFDDTERIVHENKGLDALGHMCQPRLKILYQKITKYL